MRCSSGRSCAAGKAGDQIRPFALSLFNDMGPLLKLDTPRMKLRRAIRFLMRKYMFLLLNGFEPTTLRNALAWSVAVVALPFQAAQAGQRPSGRPSVDSQTGRV
ncbi:hypothetical protein IE4872_PC00031 (plasmid) [Rhizobium gallicum]|uniref:Uncharacterized protein n=1 Tax=Rhizobium gallicum TaxID=56730 RepID=A0A1L5NQA6_9HYPH|nr:hypothetical protein IE4872_PC00031 [Rhizobium gallicum]